MRALIFNIKRFAIHDGPGIRTTFFMKGCPLECIWCHNPEGIKRIAESVGRIDRIGEMEFVRNEMIGKDYDLEDILSIAWKDRIFMDQSGGGVTFSGGEPMLQIDFLESAVRRLRSEGFNTAIDTSGMVSKDSFRRVVKNTSLFLFDLKHPDSNVHKKITGKPNNEILSNLLFLLEMGAQVEIRIPLIPGINDSEKELSGLRNYITKINNGSITAISILPFHTSGRSKYARLGLDYKMEGTIQPGPERVREVVSFFSETGIKVISGG